MPGQSWADDLPLLEEMVGVGAPLDELAQAFPHRTRDAIRMKAGALRRERPQQAKAPIEKHPRIDFGDPPKDPIDVMAWLNKATLRYDSHEHDPNKDYARVVIETDEPIAVMKSADWHFGGSDVDYHALQAHIRFLFDVPGMYLQLFGDDLNLMIMHRVTSARRDIMDPDEQIKFMHTFVHETVRRNKLISMGWGNHSDEATERTAGFGIVKVIVDNAIPYFRGLGYLDLVLKTSSGRETVYPMAFAHKTRFHSFMNQLHGNKRMQQMHHEWFPRRPLAREYITGHTHNPAIATEGSLPEDRVHFIKCGTFKTDCLYSQRYFGQGRIGVPTVVYHPDRFEHVLCHTPWEAYRYMTGHDWEGGEA